MRLEYLGQNRVVVGETVWFIVDLVDEETKVYGNNAVMFVTKTKEIILIDLDITFDEWIEISDVIREKIVKGSSSIRLSVRDIVVDGERVLGIEFEK